MTGGGRREWRLWLDLAGQSVLALRDHRLRTLLSVTGIAVGIAAVILIGVVGRGGREAIFAELQTFGLRSVWIFRDDQVSDPRRVIRAGSGIDNEDYAAVRASGCCSALSKLTPIVYGGDKVPDFVHAGTRYSRVRVEGVGGDYMGINNDSTIVGRGLSTDDVERRRRYAVIGEQVRWRLFGEQQNPLGRELRLGDQSFEVIGVLAHKDRSFLSSIGSAGGQDANARLLVPYKLVQSMQGTSDIDVLQGQVSGAQLSANAATAQVIGYLGRRHRNAYQYQAQTMEQYIATANRILGGVSTIGIIAASVSLLVAGLGILNIMSTSVLERTREIGVRKAVGGSEREIMIQFLLEAMLISTCGGVAGLLLGALASMAIVAVTGFPLAPSLLQALLALMVSVMVGLASGFYPAYRAARLSPVEALRYG